MTAQALTRSTTLSDLISLTKPRLSAQVLSTTAGGMWLAPGELSGRTWLLTLLATAGTVGAANALNCFIERDSDRFMHRTQARPLPSGRMDPQVALAFGVLLAALSLPALLVGANALTAALGLLALVSYVFVYTPLKSRSWVAMLVGAVPGALPPLMGWTAVTRSVSWPGLALFGILFFWQLPHFLAIALFRKEEYRAAGLTSVPLQHGDVSARWQLLIYLVALVAVSFSLYPLKVAGGFYAVSALLLGVLYLGHALRGVVKGLGAGWARQSFILSLIYITGLFLALMVDGVARV